MDDFKVKAGFTVEAGSLDNLVSQVQAKFSQVKIHVNVELGEASMNDVQKKIKDSAVKGLRIDTGMTNLTSQAQTFYRNYKSNIDAIDGGTAKMMAHIAKLGSVGNFANGYVQAQNEQAKLIAGFKEAGVAGKTAAQITSDAWRKSIDFDKLSSQAQDYYSMHAKNIEKNAVLSTRWAAVTEKMQDPNGYGDINQARAEIANLQLESQKAGVEVETLGQRLGRLFGAHLNTALVMAGLHALQSALVGIYQNVVQLDGAIVDLQIASGKSRSEVQSMMSDYSQMGKDLGATTLEVAQSSDTWLNKIGLPYRNVRLLSL